tara:strand:+ start:260 stop:508 length:249 start_codon:yes stop_codon:yes gene_type:complete
MPNRKPEVKKESWLEKQAAEEAKKEQARKKKAASAAAEVMDLPDSPRDLAIKPQRFGYEKSTEDLISEIKAKQELDQKRHKE